MPELSFPNESSEYRKARKELLKAEIALRQQIADVAARRSQLPSGGEIPEDYIFQKPGSGGQSEGAALSSLFENGQKNLLVYSFMFSPAMQRPCPMCSSMLDALNGNAGQIRKRVSIAVAAQSPIERITAFARERGWSNLPIVSSGRNTYQRDYFGETGDGTQMPMANVFVRDEGQIRHFWGSEMLFADLDGQPRHVDLLWPLWNALDLTPPGRGTDWYPSL
ncbi:MAG: DUF899 family protein [Gammaproteobacteria bacterium]|nr:DUF899 family protein [Gammaproteobacteria bacterium]